MDSRNAGVPNAIDSVSHRLSRQRCFFRNRNIAGAGSYDSNGSDTEVSFVAANSDESRRFMPLGLGHDVANLAKRTLVSTCHEDIRRTLREPLDDANDLRASFATPKNDFGKALPGRAGVVHACETDVLKVKILSARQRLAGRQFTGLVGSQQLLELVQIH